MCVGCFPGVWAGGAAIAYTYLVGFRALYLVSALQRSVSISLDPYGHERNQAFQGRDSLSLHSCVFLRLQKDRPSWLNTFRQRTFIIVSLPLFRLHQPEHIHQLATRLQERTQLVVCLSAWACVLMASCLCVCVYTCVRVFFSCARACVCVFVFVFVFVAYRAYIGGTSAPQGSIKA